MCTRGSSRALPGGPSTSPLDAMRTRLRAVARFAAVATLIIAGALGGCTQGKGPFLMVQLCFKDDQELADFTRLLESIAYTERMTFIDYSGPTERGLDVIKAYVRAPTTAKRLRTERSLKSRKTAVLEQLTWWATVAFDARSSNNRCRGP